ncbi:MAG: aldo/keto reductase [Defluviitaleaceae bacterium]|nr:aldo/keto reductase [Defluviitaleaceae bacterium]
MDKVILGRTGIETNKNGFGALPIQRVSKEEARKIMYKAYENGITYFDTANMYTDSEEKIGYTFAEVRKNIYIATKTQAKDAKTFTEHLDLSLQRMKTDYIDVMQFHNPPFCPKPGGEDGLYDAMLEAKKQGKIKHIGITSHKLHVAREAVESGLYETLQFPFNYISEKQDEDIVKLCEEHNVGFVVMKALSGGLITDSALAYAFLNEYKNTLPIWGIQKESELDEFLAYQNNPPVMTEERRLKIAKEKAELSGNFCRACGYCMPCPANIVISQAARMGLLLRRAVEASFTDEAGQEEMSRIDNCIDCGHCIKNCPYGLNTPELLRANYEDYKTFIK